MNTTKQSDQLGEQRKKHRFKNRAKLLAMAVLVAVTVAFAIWSVVYILARHEEKTRLAFITPRTVETTAPCSIALINQYEEIPTPAAGILVPLVEEGERVAKGDRVALIIRPDYEEYVKEYRLAGEACDARKMVLTGLGNTVEDVLPKTRSDSLMREAVVSLSQAKTIGDLAEFQRAGKQFIRAIAQYRNDALKNTEDDPELKELVREQKRLLERLEAVVVEGGVLNAPVPGTVSFLVPVSAEKRDESFWVNTDNPEADVKRLSDPGLRPADSRQVPVKADSIAFTISNSSMSTVVVITSHDPDEESRLSKGNYIDLLFGEDERLNRCRIRRALYAEEADRFFVTVSDQIGWSNYPPAIPDAQMVLKRVTGLAVPLRSLIDYREETGAAKLKKITGGVTETVSVQVLASDGAYAVIGGIGEESPVEEADLYVVNPWTVGEGVLID